MGGFFDTFNTVLGTINGVIWHDYVLFLVLAMGVLFTIWSGFSQFWAFKHGIPVIRGIYDKKGDPGAINHFQALSAALSATVGLGNIGGVAIAISLGGPGSIFWLWVVGFFGMALKTTEVTQSMLFRNTDDPDNPHGGPMWVAYKGLKQKNPSLAGIGKTLGLIISAALIISAVTGGNMFQAWNVGVLSDSYFGIPSQFTGIIMAVIVGAVILGGIKRIGAVAGRLVPFMCILYLLAAAYVLLMNVGDIPGMLKLIVVSAFNPTEASGAFVGGTVASAFLFGMKRALFSNEAGQGSAPIAHSAAKTDEPVREGVVAGLEPFIDTIVVCTLTALVILSSGVWNRPAEATFDEGVAFSQTDSGEWALNSTAVPEKTPDSKRVTGEWKVGDNVFLLIKENPEAAVSKLAGSIVTDESGQLALAVGSVASSIKPELMEPGIYADHPGAALTGRAFDEVMPGLGAILVPLAAFLFAISTMISWSYYGEQGMIFMFGQGSVMPYKIIYCLLAIVATSGLIATETELDNLTGLGTGLTLLANIPIMLIFGSMAMKAYREYIRKLRAGEFKVTGHPDAVDVIEGRK